MIMSFLPDQGENSQQDVDGKISSQELVADKFITLRPLIIPFSEKIPLISAVSSRDLQF